MRVLLIEEDRVVTQSIELTLHAEGFYVYSTDLGEEGVDLGKIYEYDLILLGLRLPDTTGLDVLRQLRAARVTTPVIMLAGDHEITTKLSAFAAGADDYLTKPFHQGELVARSRAVVRRSKGHAQPLIHAGDMALNLDQKSVTVAGAPLRLTAKEYSVLELLVLRKGTMQTKDALLNHLYGGMDEPEMKIIDVFICKLRKKLSLAGLPGIISTVWGRGYVLKEPAALAAAH